MLGLGWFLMLTLLQAGPQHPLSQALKAIGKVIPSKAERGQKNTHKQLLPDATSWEDVLFAINELALHDKCAKLKCKGGGNSK